MIVTETCEWHPAIRSRRRPESGQGSVDDSVPDWNDRSMGVSMTVSGSSALGGVHSVDVSEDETASFEADVARLRHVLGAEVFDRAYSAGLNWEQAHRLASEQLSLIGGHAGSP